MYMIGMGITVGVYLAVLLCQNLTLLIVLFFISGVACGIRLSLGYVYMMEFVPAEN